MIIKKEKVEVVQHIIYSRKETDSKRSGWYEILGFEVVFGG